MGASDRIEWQRLRNEQTQLLDRLHRVGAVLTQEEQRVRIAVGTLDKLRQEQAALKTDVRLLSDRIAALEMHLPADAVTPEGLAEILTPPVLPTIPVPPPLPQMEPSPPPAFIQTTEPVEATPSNQAHTARQTSTAHSKEARGSFEMQLGTYWLVRIGIVMLLSGMVFLGNYAYKNFVGKLGPGGKLALLYLAGGLLLGLGKWLGRKQEQLKNYAQVLFAGGLAAVYFTTYAAHHVTSLRVIASPLVDGALLLAWAGFMVWLATREKSETLALFAVGLGYYTSIITQVGLFTLYSNLVLTAAAVFFLLRNRWATLTFGSLVATYAAYAFWRFNHHGTWRWASPGEGLWTGTYFLICYWLIFTAAVFLSRHEHFRGRHRTAFLTLNNGAFFALFLLTMLQVQQGGFWKFALAYGSALLGLAVAASRVLKPDRLASNAYLTQGLLLVTLGFISYYTGLKLGLVLAVESVTLFVLSYLLRSRILFAGALTSGGLAALLTIVSLDRLERSDLYLGCGVSALLLINNLVKQARDWPSATANHLARGFFAVAGSLVLFQTTWQFCPAEFRAAVLVLEGLVLTLSCYAVSSKEFNLSGQGFIFAGQALCIIYLAGRLSNPAMTPPWPSWNPWFVGAATLFLCHWWRWQQRMVIPRPFTEFLQLIYAMVLTALLYCGVKAHLSAPMWLVAASGLAIGLTVYGAVTRAWFLAAAAQLFLVAASASFLRQVGPAAAFPNPTGWHCLVPIAACLLLSWFGLKVVVGRNRAPEGANDGIKILAGIYLWAALALSLGWTFKFVPAHDWFWVLSLLGAILFAGAGYLGKSKALLFSVCYTGVGFLMLWGRFWSESITYWPNFLAVLLLLAEQQCAKRQPSRYPVPRSFHWMTIALGSASMWMLLSKWVTLHAGGFYLTLAWGFLALVLFGTGFLLGERNYRWAGLIVLGLALARVVFFDVWKLETIYRIFTFMGLGIVLLVLGFIYNKYQEKIREWL